MTADDAAKAEAGTSSETEEPAKSPQRVGNG